MRKSLKKITTDHLTLPFKKGEFYTCIENGNIVRVTDITNQMVKFKLLKTDENGHPIKSYKFPKDMYDTCYHENFPKRYKLYDGPIGE